MKVYYGIKGNSHFIMCQNSMEIYEFDSFGNLVSTLGTVSSCESWLEVDYLSFVGVGTSDCELLYKNLKARLRTPISTAIRPVRQYCNFLGTMFSIPHEDELGKFNQILFVFKKGEITDKMVFTQYPNVSWKTISNMG